MEGHWGGGRRETLPHVVTVLCFCPGSGKVPAWGERGGHAAVHPLSHAGESTAPGVQPERRDPHQTGPVLCTGRHPQAAGNRSRSPPRLFFAILLSLLTSFQNTNWLIYINMCVCVYIYIRLYRLYRLYRFINPRCSLTIGHQGVLTIILTSLASRSCVSLFVCV